MAKRRNQGLAAKVRARDRNICQCCYFTCADPLDVHHIEPVFMGGADDMNNMITLCPDCHKYAPDEPEEFYEYQMKGGKGAQYDIVQRVLESVYGLNDGRMTVKELWEFHQEIRIARFRQAWNRVQSLSEE